MDRQKNSDKLDTILLLVFCASVVVIALFIGYLVGKDSKTTQSQTQNIIINEAQDSKVNINTATKSELMSIYGVGDKLADKIIAYRQKTSFKSIYDLTLVDGIGENLVKENERRLTIE